MNEELEIFKKKLLYRASYRGTKEMDILLSAFVKKHIEDFDLNNLNELENFLKFDDEIILNFYNHNKIERDIDKNPISKIFKNFRYFIFIYIFFHYIKVIKIIDNFILEFQEFF